MIVLDYSIVNLCKLCKGTYAELVCVHLNYRKNAEQRGTFVFIHWGWSNKTEAFEELVGVSTGRDTWRV